MSLDRFPSSDLGSYLPYTSCTKDGLHYSVCILKFGNIALWKVNSLQGLPWALYVVWNRLVGVWVLVVLWVSRRECGYPVWACQILIVVLYYFVVEVLR